MFEPGHFEKLESYLPIDLLNWNGFLVATTVVNFFVVFRYFLIVGPFYFVFWKKKIFISRQIYKKLPENPQIITEIKWSMITSIIFALAGVGIGVMWQLGWTQIYLKFDQYPIWWLPTSFLVMSLIHELYFYLTHRLMHHPVLYKKIHHVHHLSLRPSPWASFSFHPLESVIESLILPLLLVLVPVHPVVFLCYLTGMTVSAIVNHLGFEILPVNASRHWFWKNFITGTHHGQHHKYYDCNYGLYFTFLDRWWATEHPKYTVEFDEVRK